MISRSDLDKIICLALAAWEGINRVETEIAADLIDTIGTFEGLEPVTVQSDEVIRRGLYLKENYCNQINEYIQV